MRVEFRLLGEDDMEQILRVRRVAYGPAADRRAARGSLSWRLPHSMGAFANGRLVSMSFMYPLGAFLGGRRVTYGGLSGVATAPEARRQGVVAQGIRRWFTRLHEQGVGWSAEHPFDPTFYGRLGYQTVHNGHTLDLPIARLKATTGTRVEKSDTVAAEPVGAESLEELRAVYAKYAPRFSFALTRDDGVKDHWGTTLKRPWEDEPKFAYALEDAYVIFGILEAQEDGESLLEVRDLAYSSPAGRRRAFALLTSFEGQVKRVRLHLPPGEQVAVDWAAWHSESSPELQVRIVDVASALRDLVWAEPVRLSLRVSDPDCEWNDGTFSLDLGPEGAEMRRIDGSTPDAGLDIRALAALVTGTATAETMIADGRAEGDASRLRPLASALAGHPVFKPHNDHF